MGRKIIEQGGRMNLQTVLRRAVYVAVAVILLLVGVFLGRMLWLSL